MGNEYTAGDFTPHLIYGLTLHKLVAWHTAGDTTVVSGGHHPKMRLRHVWVMVSGAALNATEPTLGILHGANSVVADSTDMATELGTTAALGVMEELDIVDQYKDLAASEALIISIDGADGGAVTEGFFTLEYELIE